MEWLARTLLLASLAAANPGDDRARAQEEIEQQMRQMVKVSPPQLDVVFAGVDKSVFELEDAHFSLDDESLALGGGEISQLTASGPKTLYTGAVDPGLHQLMVKLVYHRNDVSLFSGLRTFKYRIESSVPFRADKGLALHVRLALHVDDRQEDPKKQLTFLSEIKPEMLGGIDDAPLPELAAKKAAQPTAPPPIIHADPVVAPSAPPPPPAGAQQTIASAEPSRPKLADPVEQLKRKLRTDPIKVAVASPPPAPSPPQPTSANVGPQDAGLLAVLPLDAGRPAEAAKVVVDAGSPTDASTNEPSYTWVWIGLALFGGAVLVIALSRRRSAPPPPEI